MVDELGFSLSKKFSGSIHFSNLVDKYKGIVLTKRGLQSKKRICVSKYAFKGSFIFKCVLSWNQSKLLHEL